MLGKAQWPKSAYSWNSLLHAPCSTLLDVEFITQCFYPILKFKNVKMNKSIFGADIFEIFEASWRRLMGQCSLTLFLNANFYHYSSLLLCAKSEISNCCIKSLTLAKIPLRSLGYICKKKPNCNSFFYKLQYHNHVSPTADAMQQKQLQ